MIDPTLMQQFAQRFGGQQQVAPIQSAAPVAQPVQQQPGYRDALIQQLMDPTAGTKPPTSQQSLQQATSPMGALAHLGNEYTAGFNERRQQRERDMIPWMPTITKA